MSDMVDVDPPLRAAARACDTFTVFCDGGTLLRLTGELDLATAPTFAAALEPLVDTGGTIGIDLTQLQFMDCSGINILCHAAHALGTRGRLVVYDPTPAVRRLLDLTLSTILDIDDDPTSRSATEERQNVPALRSQRSARPAGTYRSAERSH